MAHIARRPYRPAPCNQGHVRAQEQDPITNSTFFASCLGCHHPQIAGPHDYTGAHWAWEVRVLLRTDLRRALEGQEPGRLHARR